MKRIARQGLGLLLILSLTAVWLLTSGMSSRMRRSRTCQGKGTLEVTVTDSLERQFVTKADVESWLEKEYRAYAGMPLDSVDLDRIEHIIEGHSAVRESEAWLTDDGILHVALSQRQPVVRFDSGTNGYYADQSGFIFPLQSRGTADVPVVDGKIPLTVPKGFKGEPASDTEKAWLKQVLNLVSYMKGTVWEGNVTGITVDAKGNLVLTPREGKEKFIFGEPVRFPEKFRLMKAYYESVVPSKEEGYYRSVDLRYRGQLVCRK